MITRIEILEVMVEDIQRGYKKDVWIPRGYRVVDLDHYRDKIRERRADQKQWSQVLTTGLQALAAKKREAARKFFGMP